MRYLLISAIVLFLSFNSSYSQKQKIILDTDIGSDIDDAFALALVLASDEFEVLGITTGEGFTDKRAQLVCKFLYEVGKEDIPVAVGRKTYDFETNRKKNIDYFPQIYWAEGFDKVKPIETPADDFIIEMLHKYPGEVIIFTIGPVTNMGDILRKEPDVLKLSKHIYSMFGSFYLGYNSNPVPFPEWNVAGDVESSRLFVNSGAELTFAGLDVTGFVKIDKEVRLKLLMRQSPLTNTLTGLYSLFDSFGSGEFALFDAVAIGMYLWPELFRTRDTNVKVMHKGFTVMDDSKEPNCKIGMYINKDEFLRQIMRRYLRQNLSRE